MDFVTSPCGTKFPRTPANVAAYEKTKISSNEKHEKKMDAVKIEDDADDIESLKLRLMAEAKGREEMRQEMERYRDEMGRMQEHMMVIEKLLEDKEGRFEEELGAERKKRSDLEERLRGMKDASNPLNHCDLATRELEVRKRELDLAEKRLDAREADAISNADAFECCLSVSDPSGDVLCDLSMLRSLEGSLKNEKTSVTTIAGLLDYALEKNAELRDILKSIGQFSVRFVLQKFKNKFKSLHRISKTSMSVVTVLLIGKLYPDKTRAAVKYAGSKFKIPLLKVTPSVAKSGSVPVLDEAFKLFVLSDLPGIAQLLSTTDKGEVEDHWRVLEEFVVAAVCHIKDVKKKLVQATADLDAFSGKQMDDAGEMLAAFNRLFDVCTSWLGTAVEGDFQKIQRFLKVCPGSVQDEYADSISPKYDGVRIDELSMQWTEFETLIQTVWESSLIKKSVRSGFGRSEEIVVPDACDLPPSYAAAAASRAPPARATEPVVDHFKKIDCRKCEKPFSPSMKQFQKFEELKIPLPEECPKCKGQICDNFRDSGACAYGDACKFLHPTGEAAVVPDKGAAGEGPKKHSYPCRFNAVGRCMAGNDCRFRHDAGEPGTVMNISEVDSSVYNISEVQEDGPLAVEVYNRFDRFRYVPNGKDEYRYV
jgi:hypothetical protein